MLNQDGVNDQPKGHGSCLKKQCPLKKHKKLIRPLKGILVLCIVLMLINTPKELLFNKNIVVQPKILRAIARNKPVLALESTIITHGLPYPTNIETQRELESISQSQGVVPATIAVLNGKIHIGLTGKELDNLGQAEGVLKSSSFDIAYPIAFKKNASTTVAATARLAEMVGIHVFSTGGIGGFHRIPNDQIILDVSADIKELSLTNTIVVSAGCKQILDLQNTAEALETNQVLTVGFNTSEMPAFYSAKSGIKLDYRVNNTKQAATLYMANKMKGYLLYNPVPPEYDIALEKDIQDAIKMMPKEVKGKQVTPYLLAKLKDITKNKSVDTNLALIRNNVKIGAQVSRDISKQISGCPFCTIAKNPAFYVMSGIFGIPARCTFMLMILILASFKLTGLIIHSIMKSKCCKSKLMCCKKGKCESTDKEDKND